MSSTHVTIVLSRLIAGEKLPVSSVRCEVQHTMSWAPNDVALRLIDDTYLRIPLEKDTTTTSKYTATPVPSPQVTLSDGSVVPVVKVSYDKEKNSLSINFGTGTLFGIAEK